MNLDRKGETMNDIKRIAINTGGGDAPGLNAVIHAVVHAAHTHDWEIHGIRDGFDGKTAVAAIAPSVAIPASGQDGDFSRARPAAFLDCMQRSEAEVTGADRSKGDFLQTRVVLDVGK